MTAYDPSGVVGFCAPNRRLSEIDGGAGAFWGRMGLSGARWIKLLYPDHQLADAVAARKRGMGVILRAPGEGIVDWRDVLNMIHDFKGYVQLIEVGNEPDHSSPLALQKHLDALEDVADHCLYAAFASNILLSAPGWDAQAEPPKPLADELSLRMWNIYNRFPRISAHAYGVYNFDGQLARVGRWQACWRKTTYITEAGIAARDLISVAPASDHYGPSAQLKAERYGQFVKDAAAQGIPSVCFFIDRGSLDQWGAFDRAGDPYNPNGKNSYWLTDQALSTLRDAARHEEV